jgi:uncharacterized protein (DUF2126 family)
VPRHGLAAGADLRHLGLAARFVSGYLIQLTPDVKAVDGPVGAEADFTDLHAWCEVYLPGAGWIGLDPTSGLLAGEGHIPLACTPEPGSAAPVSGAVDECEVQFEHHMSITRIYESPRVTKPYTAQWTAIDAAGLPSTGSCGARRAPDDGRRADLRLGARPRRRRMEHRRAGPHQARAGHRLVHKLRARYGAGGFLHFGQGKWYPGEQLPRWALSICWRADGQPCWQTLAVRRRTRARSLHVGRCPALPADAGAPAGSTGCIQPGYEDVWYYLWRERKLPVNVDPHEARLDDELERARLRRVFDAGLAGVTGYVLPLARGEGMAGLDHRPLVPARRAHVPAARRFANGLPPAARFAAVGLEGRLSVAVRPGPVRAARAAAGGRAAARAMAAGMHRWSRARRGAGRHPPRWSAGPPELAGRAGARESDKDAVRTALCVEVRHPSRAAGPAVELKSMEDRRGILYVFMPPLTAWRTTWLLLAEVEATAAELGVKIVLEGYPPPRDPRLKLLQVTPDPGVIEVNIHPASNWAELVDHTEFLYQAAHETHLSTEKFMVDGRHTAPAAATTSCWAAPRRRTARSCAAPTCWPA